ncbi:MAG: sugar phosphate isomerase/epimerase [Chloroflexi bacterium]|nr:sugar phosphate isomerase/epimerase [Chloroflexota bacterium]
MSERRITVSGFGDEIAAEPSEQLRVLADLGIHHLDLRGAWERNILDFTDGDVQAMRRALSEHGARVATIASPIGKSAIGQEPAYEAARLARAIELAQAFETPLIRLFSFYHDGVEHAACRDEVVRRLAGWARTAERVGITLLLENEADLWGDTPERCRDLLTSVDSPALRLTLDAGNFAGLGVRPADDAYPLLKSWLAHIQIKDVVTATRSVVPAGQGDGQIRELLRLALTDGYTGYLSLEPHLAVAGKAGGFSGPELFGVAARALEAIRASLGANGA